MSAIAGVLGAGASIFDNFLNSEQNEAQRDWAEYMWNKNNEYNTPANQMKRLRDAGINPHFAISGGSLGTGTSSSPGSMTQPHPYDFSPASDAVARSVELYQQKRLQDAEIGYKNSQAENIRLQNVTQLYRDLEQLRNLRKSGDLTERQEKLVRAQEHRLWLDISSLAERNEVEIDKARSETYLNNALEREARLKGDFQSIVNQYEIPNRQKVLRNLDAQYQSILAAAASGNAAAASALADAALKGVQKETAEKIKKHVVDKAFQEVEAIKDERELKWIRENREERGEGKRFPSAVGTFETSKSYYRTRFQNGRK